MNKSILVVLAVGTALSSSATQHWNTQGHEDTLLSKAANYNEKKDPNYGVAGGDSNLGGFPTGTYTLDADMTANRIVFDAKNGARAEFNLQGHTLTLLGAEQTGGAWAFGVPTAGSEATVRLTSGTIRVPWQPEAGKAQTNCYFKVGRESTATNFTFVVDGAAARLEADKVDFAGNYNTLRIENGGLGIAEEVTFANASNRLVVTGAGSSLTVKTALSPGNGGTGNTVTVADGATATVRNLNLVTGTGNGVVIGNGAVMTASGSVNLGSGKSNGQYIRVTGEGSVLKRQTAGSVTVGASIWAKNAVLEVCDGGMIENFTGLNLGGGNATSGNSGHLLAFRGSKTSVSLPLASTLNVGVGTVVENGGCNCRVEVTDGATLTLAGSDRSKNRAWIATVAGAHDNGVLVSGAGSKLIADTSGAWLIGQNGYCNTLRVTDGGFLQTGNGLTAGQGDNTTSKANENAIVVDHNGVLVANGCLNVGYGSLGKACSNRFEILSGGIVTNLAGGIRIGSSTNAHYCTFHIDNGFLYDSGHVYVGLLGRRCRMTLENGSVFTNVTGDVRAGADSSDSSPSNVIEVLSGSAFYTQGSFRLCGVGAALTVSNGTVACGGTLQLPFDKDTASDPVVTIAGANTAISSTGEILKICRNATLNFIVPATGYAGTVFRSGKGKTLTVKDLKSVNWSIPDALIEQHRTIVLGEPGEGGSLAVDAAALAKLNENLPDNCRVRVSGKKLVLKAGLNGLMVLIK